MPTNDARKQALKAAVAAEDNVRKMLDRFEGQFETVTDSVWPHRGVQRAIAVVLSAANADEVIDEMIRGVDAGAGLAHTETRRSGQDPTHDVARNSVPGARAGRNALDTGTSSTDTFTSPSRTPLTGRRGPRDESSEDGPATSTRARASARAEADVHAMATRRRHRVSRRGKRAPRAARGG